MRINGSESADLNAVSFLEAYLRTRSLSGEAESIPKHLLPWGGPTLSMLWPPGGKLTHGLVPDLDSTAWHFKLNRMPIPSAVTNRFLSESPLPEPYATACVAPDCQANRIPRMYASGLHVDFLAALNFASGLDDADALNAQVKGAVSALESRLSPNDVQWSVRPEAARDALLAVYKGKMAPAKVTGFVYRRELPDGAVVEIENSEVARLLATQSKSSSSSN
ncbi:MAG: hypothetical protein AAFY60_20550 [Myxococcota bacterium]